MVTERILPESVSRPGKLKEAISIAVGAASVCWESMDGTGVFQDERALQIVEELFEIVNCPEEGSGRQLETFNEYSPYQVIARGLVFDYVREHLDKIDAHVTFGIDEVYVVWFSKILKNWKALLSTTLPDGMYYEVTFNGHDGVAYLDAYKKFDNREFAIPASRR